MPALIDDDQTRERRHPPQVVSVERVSPAPLEVLDELRQDHQIDRAIADDLIGDRRVGAPGVPDLGDLHLGPSSAR